MTPHGITKDQLVAQLKEQRTALDRRLRVTQESIKLLDEAQPVRMASGNDAHVPLFLSANDTMLDAMISAQLIQLRLNETEAVEQLEKIDATLQRAESVLSAATLVPGLPTRRFKP